MGLIRRTSTVILSAEALDLLSRESAAEFARVLICPLAANSIRARMVAHSKSEAISHAKSASSSRAAYVLLAMMPCRDVPLARSFSTPTPEEELKMTADPKAPGADARVYFELEEIAPTMPQHYEYPLCADQGAHREGQGDGRRSSCLTCEGTCKVDAHQGPHHSLRRHHYSARGKAGQT